MKKLYSIITCLVCALLISSSISLSAQSVGIGTKTPSPSAILDISSTTKGVLIPRLTAAEINSIDKPADGLLVFQTDAPYGFRYFDTVFDGWRSFYRELSAPDTIKIIPDGSVTTAKFADKTIQTEDIKNDAINSTHFADKGISGKDIAPKSITNVKIRDASVDLEKFAGFSGISDGDLLIWDNAAKEWSFQSSGVAGGGFQYKGNWDALTNNPPLSVGAGVDGEFYIVNRASGGALHGLSDSYEAGDWIIRSGGNWTKIEGARTVNSVFGRKGDVVAEPNDYKWEQLQKNSSGDLTGSDIFAIADVNGGSGIPTQGNTIVWNATSNRWELGFDAGGGASNQVGTDGIANDAIVNSHFKDATLNASDFAAASITEAKIKDSIFLNTHFKDKSITIEKLSGAGANDGDVWSYDSVRGVWKTRSLITALQFQGTWEPLETPDVTATNGSPDLKDATATAAGVEAGYFYVANSEGKVNFGDPGDTLGPFEATSGIANDTVFDFNAGDWAIYSQNKWTRVETNYPVKTLFGRTGAITAQTGDYTWDQITGNIPLDSLSDFDAASAGLTDTVIFRWESTSSSFKPFYDKGNKSNKIDSVGIAAAAIDGAVHLTDSSITKIKLKDSSLTGAKFADLSITSREIKDGTIINANIAVRAIDSSVLLDRSITGAKIKDSVITSNKIKVRGIASSNIGNGSITLEKIRPLNVLERHLQDNIFQTVHIEDKAVTGEKIKNNILTDAYFSNNSITLDKFALNTLESIHVIDGSITTAKIADDAITYDKLKDEIIDSTHIKDASIFDTHLADSIVTLDKVGNNSINSAKVVDKTIEGKNIKARAVTNAKIADKAITSDKISASIAIGGASPNSNAVLDLQSTTRGFLPPRTTIDKFSGLGPADAGLLIYETSIDFLTIWNGERWLRIGSSPCRTEASPCPNSTAHWQSASPGDFIKFGVGAAEKTYGVLAYKGRYWLDRNFGADARATSKSHSQSYGDYFQWGRQADGHNSSGSSETNTPIANASYDGSQNLFINKAGNWLQSPDNDLWDDVSGDNNPCPPGWRIPTLAEFQDLDFTSSDDAYDNLRISLAGHRETSGGAPVLDGDEARFWTSNVSTVDADDQATYYYINETLGYIRETDQDKTTGASVRCIKDE